MAAIRRLLTNECSRNAPPAPAGRQIITRDTRLRGFYRVDGATCSTYYCQADCTDAIGRRRTIRRKIEDVQLIDVDDARNKARKLIAKIKAGEFTGTDRPHEVTLEEAWRAFQDSRGHRLSKETLRSYQKSIETVLGELMDLPLRRLSETAAARKEIRDMHRRVTDERGPYSANRAF